MKPLVFPMRVCFSIYGTLARASIAYDELETIPASLVLGVQLCDAALEPRGTLREDCINHRMLCGEGALQPQKFIQAVRRCGYRGIYGVEIISEEHRSRVLEDAAGISFDTARTQFASLEI